jgi:predicted P-loop ATPase
MQEFNFKRIAEAARNGAESLIKSWLPDGKREGREWSALNPTRSDTKLGSFKINLSTGAWADFSSGDQGGDLISLFAYLHGMDQLAAARDVAAQLGMSAEEIEAQPAKAAAPKSDKPVWKPLDVVPADAPVAPVAHPVRGKPEMWWAYQTAQGGLIGYVYRFRTSDGGKETLPLCYAESDTGRREWRWLSFRQPRPLFCVDPTPWGYTLPALIVEGEKCVARAAEVLGADFRVVSWPGGCKAVKKADWTQVKEQVALIWPDADEPGLKAARDIAEILHAQGVEVWGIRKEALADKPAGWDIYDAIEEGMTHEQVLQYIEANKLRWQPTVAGAKSILTPPGASAGKVYSGEDWRNRVPFETIRGGLKDCRENVIYLLRDHPEWRGVLAIDEFAKRIVVRKPSPIGHAAGQEWGPTDDTELALWFQAQERMLVRSTETVAQGVRYVGKLNGFHPVREFLDALTWDKHARVDRWVVEHLGAEDNAYHRLVGRFFLINMIRRIYEPGCIMRSVPVLEGEQDKGKSRALRALAQPWFSDTPFRVGDKDAYQQIQGVWVYEISELESFSKSEATAVKAFVSSTEDNFRAPYERMNEKHARQTVFGATTNGTEYLKDWSGNTRFHPLATGKRIDLETLGAARDQLLAEACVLYRSGARAYPSPEQQAALFKPEQDKRLMAHPWVELILDWLDRDMKNTVTILDVLYQLKVDMARIQPNGSEAQTVGRILASAGWHKRQLGESRSWHWVRPAPLPQPDGAPVVDEDEGALSVPF